MSLAPILLVEDNRDDEELILLALKDHKIANDIVVAHDGVEALEYIFATGAYTGRDPLKLPAIVLLDLKLPKLNGMDVLSCLRTDPRTKLLPIVVLTSSNEEDDIINSYNLGANSYVRKPIDFQEFHAVVKHLSIYWLLVNTPAIIQLT
ncbi:MAG TPA: response regulator [Candidatus Kapabacteria bacterium]|nr:response regulator [Candidatus Kapabacteria bacterium]